MRTHIIHTNEIDVSFGSYDAAEEAAREALLGEYCALVCVEIERLRYSFLF